MATKYPEGFEPISDVKSSTYPEGFIPIQRASPPAIQRDLNLVPEEFRQEQILLNEPSLTGAARRLGSQYQSAKDILSVFPKASSEIENLIKQGSNGQLTQGNALGSALKTALETGARVVGDPVTFLASKAEEYRNNPSASLEDALRLTIAPFPMISALIPSGTSQEDLESQIRKSQLSQAIGLERSKGYISNVPGVNSLPGQVQSNVSDVGLLLSPGATKSGRAAIRSIPAVSGIENAIRATGNIVGGTAKSIVKSVLPKSVESEFVTALNPGSNPVQVQRATQAVKTVIPNVSDVIERSGFDFNTAAGAREVSNFAKNDIWSEIEAKTGQPLLADASAVGDAYYSVSTDPVVMRLFPEAIPQLEAEAAKYIGQRIPVQELEQIKQAFNAINQTKETMTKSKKAALLKSDPIYAASDTANEAIGAILEDQFGPEFSANKKQWGAWKQINDLATKEAIKQDILDNKITPFEGLGILGAVAQGMAQEGSLVRGAGTALAGKALKYVNSPDARFSTLSRKLPPSQSK